MRMLCFKFQQNHTINEEFDYFEEGGGEPPKILSGVPEGNKGLDYKNLRMPHTERWSQPTPKISAFQLN